jgi:hypothetical protein
MMCRESGAVFSYARFATIRAISAHSGLVKKLRRSFCLGTLMNLSAKGGKPFPAIDIQAYPERISRSRL